MGETDYNALLYDKMKAEQDKYRDWLLNQPPEEILNHTYEYTMREDIVMCMEELELSPKQAKALLRSPCPLDDVYKEFRDREVGHMNYSIREMRKEEYSLLGDFLYEAIYIPDGTAAPPKSVIACPELQVYIADFGNSKHDKALIAEVDGNIVGAIWARIMNDYGHIDDNTPSLAMSVLKAYRGMGIGTSLLTQMMSTEKAAGYAKLSLSVQKDNYAVKLYRKAGFIAVKETDEEYIMIVNLNSIYKTIVFDYKNGLPRL